jgi:hypothetical protein
MEQAIELVSKLGFPVAVALGLLYGAWKLAQWCGSKADQWVHPLLTQHFTLVDSLKKSTDRNTETLEKHSALLEQHTLQSATTTAYIAESIEHKKHLDSTITALAVELRAHREKTEDGPIRHKTD